jgi:hypothetical protein
MVMRRCAAAVRPETPQKIQLPGAKQRDIGEGISTRQHREQTQQQYLIERVGHFAGLARIREILEMPKKHDRLFSGRSRKASL